MEENTRLDILKVDIFVTFCIGVAIDNTQDENSHTIGRWWYFNYLSVYDPFKDNYRWFIFCRNIFILFIIFFLFLSRLAEMHEMLLEWHK